MLFSMGGHSGFILPHNGGALVLGGHPAFHGQLIKRVCKYCMCNMDPDTLEGDHDSVCPRSSRSSPEEEEQMFHGTSEDFARSIERSGFRPSADGMLGRGVYLSRDFNKAAAFGRSRGPSASARP
jgi:hypothetical protein